MKYRIFSLNNEKGFNDVINILNAKPFELSENLIEGGYMEQETFISVSDDARVNNFNLPISCVIGFRLCNKKNLTTRNNEIIKVYADNGGSFYPYKINKQFENNEFINNILKYYQITNDLKNEMFNVNCLTYALMMSGKFKNDIIDNFKIECFTRNISHKQPEELGEDFNISFKVVKYREDQNKFDDITRGKKVIGSNKKDSILIELALIYDHYILNETIEGINKYALEHYTEIKKSCPDKNDEWIFKVNKKIR